jgi:hypothetical protein
MDLNELVQKVSDAEKQVVTELQKRWPKGSRVSFYLRSGQINASNGTVIGYGGRYGHVRISVDKKPDSSGRYRELFVRDISYKKIED